MLILGKLDDLYRRLSEAFSLSAGSYRRRVSPTVMGSGQYIENRGLGGVEARNNYLPDGSRYKNA